MATYKTTEAMLAANPPTPKRKGRVGFAVTPEVVGIPAIGESVRAAKGHRDAARTYYQEVKTPTTRADLDEAKRVYQEAKAADEAERSSKGIGDVKKLYDTAVASPAAPAIGRSAALKTTEFEKAQHEKLGALLDECVRFLDSYALKHPDNGLAEQKSQIVKKAKEEFIRCAGDPTPKDKKYQNVIKIFNQYQDILSKPVSAGDGLFGKIKQFVFELFRPGFKSRGADIIDRFNAAITERNAVRGQERALQGEREVLDQPPPSTRRPR